MNVTEIPSRKVHWGLIFFIIISFCEALWKLSSNPASRIAGYYLYPFGFICFFVLSIYYIARDKLYSLCTNGHIFRVLLYACFLTVLLLYGFLRGNNTNSLTHEAILLYSLVIFLLLGVDNRRCDFTIKLMTMVFWAAFILSLLTMNTKVPIDIFTELSEDFIQRKVNSVAYVYFRPFIDLGLPLFICGWLEKTRRWHYLQILSLLGYIVINVVFFKFRHALLLAALVVLSSFMMMSDSMRRVKLVSFFLVVSTLTAVWFFSTSEGDWLAKRIKEFDKPNSAVEYRTPEIRYYFNTMGYEWLWGRGIGGTFYGGRTPRFKIYLREGVHVGWITFTLKGGLPLLFIMFSFFAAGIKRNKKILQSEPFYLMAKYWTPVLFIDWLMDPITLQATTMPVYGLSFMLMAQFGKRYIAYKDGQLNSRVSTIGRWNEYRVSLKMH